MSDTDLELLARYTRNRAEDAFTEIVRRHLDLVHSAALRQVRSPQLAEEVAQSAFTDLARNAHRLTGGGDAPSLGSLTPWLYQVTRRTAIDVVRREARRQSREQIATEMNAMNATLSRHNEMAADANDWTHIEPLLDEAMSALDDTDRSAVLLRYFENKSLREVGATLGTSDDAAQKRVSRAVERLREFFIKRGVTVGASGLAVVISANAVQAAPACLAVTISTAVALAGTTIAVTTATATATKAIIMTTLQKTLITVAIAAGVATPLMIQHRAQVKLREENQYLRQQADQLTQLAAENERLSNLVAQSNQAKPPPSGVPIELLRLRGEVGTLRRQNQEFAKAFLDRQQPTTDFEPSTSWADAGNASPEAAAGTFAWAVKEGNKGKLVELLMFPQDQGNTNLATFVEDIVKDFQPMMSEIEASRLVLTENPAPDEVTFWYQSRFKDGHTLVSPLTFKRFGDQWKIKLVVGGDEAGN